MGFNKEGETEAPFNMAIATLKRLDSILQQITSLDFDYPRDSVEKQKIHIGLVKKFFINATPLFKDDNEKKGNKNKKDNNDEKEHLKKLHNEILDFQVDKKHGIKSGTQISRHVYSEKKEKRLNEILIEIQQRLKKFFMPGKREVEGLI